MRKMDHFEEAAKDGQLSGLGFGQGQEGERRIHLSTFLAPLLFMVLHHLVLSGASVVRLLYFLGKNPQYQEALLQDPAGTSMMEILLEGNVMTYASLMGMLVLIPAYLLYLTYRKRKAIPLLLCQRISPSQLFSSLSIILGALGLTQVWMVILASLDPASLPGRLFQDYLDKMMLFDGRSADLPLELLVTVVLVPLGEELLFRGIVQGELRRSFSPAITVVATTLLFAIFHLDLIQGSYVLIAGFALSVSYQLTRNILLPILMHMVFNFIGSGWFSRLMGGGETAELILVCFLYASILLGAFGFYYLLKKEAGLEKAGP
ncbi:MAG: CPBP family intramembrane metalloprotease [Clostridiaceae bacterium]|nr:CPBP family intramembrane metalloprotease [Clostridiaceae bacterium]